MHQHLRVALANPCARIFVHGGLRQISTRSLLQFPLPFNPRTLKSPSSSLGKDKPSRLWRTAAGISCSSGSSTKQPNRRPVRAPKSKYPHYANVYHDDDIIVVDSDDTLQFAALMLFEKSSEVQKEGIVTYPRDGVGLKPVGLDCEWQPFERHEPATPVSILQVVTRKHAFLIDLLYWCRPLGMSQTPEKAGQESTAQQQEGGEELSRSEGGEEGSSEGPEGGAAGHKWELNDRETVVNEFLQCLFSANHLTLSGFAFSHDLFRLQSSYPHLPVFQPNGAAGPGNAGAVLDLGLMAPEVLKRPRLQGRRLPLRALVAMVLKRELDKTEQCSAWGQRPLTKAQRRYAALDAHVLVAVLDTWMHQFPASAVAAISRCRTPEYRRDPQPRSAPGGAWRRSALNLPRATEPITGPFTTPLTSSSLRGPGDAGPRSHSAGFSTYTGTSRVSRRTRLDPAHLHVDVPTLLESQLGRFVEGCVGGQGEVVRAVAGRKVKNVQRNSVGVVQWANVDMVFANVDDTSHTPRWLHQGKAIEWPQGAETMQVTQQAKAMHDLCESPGVLLWVRHRRSPYVCCGSISPSEPRTEAADADTDAPAPAGSVWNLDHFSELVSRPVFRNILSQSY